MGEGEIRLLQPNFIAPAEQARQSNDVRLAANLAAMGMGLTEHGPLTDKEVAIFSENPVTRSVLACLARIHVDASKSVANQSKFPGQAIGPLEDATMTTTAVLHNSVFKESLQGVHADHEGRPHNFLPHMARDEGKLLQAASLFYRPDKANDLAMEGERLLQHTYDTLPPADDTKPLIKIEIELSKAARGAQVNMQELKENFNALLDHDEKVNPHQAATVASWLVVWGERLKNDELHASALQAFTRITQEHPAWAYMTGKERKRTYRNALFKLLARFPQRPKYRQRLEELQKNLLKK